MSESETPKKTRDTGSKAPSGVKASDLSNRLSSSAQRRIAQMEDGYTAALQSFEKQCSNAAERSETTISNATERMSKQIRTTESEIANLSRTMRRIVILPSIIVAAVCALIAGSSLYLAWQNTPTIAGLMERQPEKVIQQNGSTWIRIEQGSQTTTDDGSTWAKLHGSD